ncbi:hypothetical protein LDENG_00195030, partial [Lucifuga dentata]
MESFNFIQHVSGSTHTGGHTLDLVFSLGLSVDNVRLEDAFISDHKCILFNTNFSAVSLPRSFIRSRFLNVSSLEKFSSAFLNSDLSVYTSLADVDALVHSFTETCCSILDVAPLKVRKANVKCTPWINEDILSFKRNCRRTERLWKTTKLHVHYLHLKDLLASYNTMIKEARAAYFSQLIIRNKGNPRVLFNTINRIVSPTVPAIPVCSSSDCDRFLSY